MNEKYMAKTVEKGLLLSYPPCTTCIKAEKWLKSHKIQYISRNIKDESLNYSELEVIIASSHESVDKFFNTSGLQYRALGLAKKRQTMTREEKLTVLASDGMLVKRPLFILGEKVLIGFKEDVWEAFFADGKRAEAARPLSTAVSVSATKKNSVKKNGEPAVNVSAAAGELPKRSEVDQALTWDAASVMKDAAAWEKAYATLEKKLVKKSRYQGKMAQSGQNLLAAIEEMDKLWRYYEPIAVYSHMMHDTDTSDSRYAALQSRSIVLAGKLAAYFAFFHPELNAISNQALAALYTQEPGLERYRHAVEEVRRMREHTLSDKEERLLARATRALGSAEECFSALNDTDALFPEMTDENGKRFRLTHGRYAKCLESRDPRVREEAFRGIYGYYKQFRHTFANTLKGAVSVHNFSREIRGFKSAREAALFGNAIPETVYEHLLETVHEHLPLLHRYVELRKKVMNLTEIHSYDLYVPLSRAEYSVSFPEAKELVLNALAPLGPRYRSILEQAFAERWIDVVENQGKRSGAYSGGAYDTKPFILLNWQDTLDNVFTLAHELGHSVHSYLTRTSQPHIYGDYSIFLAEIASTTNENLLTAYLLANEKQVELRKRYIAHYLDGFKGTVFRQTQFAEFEQLIHQADAEGTALTADYLSQEYARINTAYYGKGLTADPEIALEWARIPHFYYNFYVYQYATGFSAASAFAQAILSKEDAEAVERYLEFLSAGSSAYPLDVLKKAGLDMTAPAPIEAACRVFEDYLGQMEALCE